MISNGEIIYILIPAYNEVRTIRRVIKSALTQSKYVILVDDASTDSTIDQVSDLPIDIIRHNENVGKAAALATGFKLASTNNATAVITMDGDGQHLSEYIPLFVEKARQNPNSIIIGSRLWDRESFPTIRYWGNQIANFWISWAAGVYIEDSQCGFRLYPQSVLAKVRPDLRRKLGFVFESEVLIDAAHQAFNIRFIKIPAIYPKNEPRPSHFRPAKDVTRIVLMVAKKLLLKGMHPIGLWRLLQTHIARSRSSAVGASAARGTIRR